MVYIRLNESLKRVLGKKTEGVIDIGEEKYIPYSILRQKHPALIIQQNIRSEDVVSKLTIQVLQQPPPPPEHLKLMKQLHYKHQRRAYQKILDPKKANRTYFEVTPDQGIREMEKSISFALTFIFSFFLAGATGYLLGIYIFNVGHVKSMIICIFFVIGTLFVEALLFVIRSNRMDETKAKKEKMKQEEKLRRYNMCGSEGVKFSGKENVTEAKKVTPQQKKKQ